MINWLKKLWYKDRLKSVYAAQQKEAARTLKRRMKDIARGQKFLEIVKKLQALGIENPKEIVIGKRPPTGRIK